MKFYICEHCGNIVTFLQSSGVPVMSPIPPTRLRRSMSLWSP